MVWHKFDLLLMFGFCQALGLVNWCREFCLGLNPKRTVGYIFCSNKKSEERSAGKVNSRTVQICSFLFYAIYPFEPLCHASQEQDGLPLYTHPTQPPAVFYHASLHVLSCAHVSTSPLSISFTHETRHRYLTSRCIYWPVPQSYLYPDCFCVCVGSLSSAYLHAYCTILSSSRTGLWICGAIESEQSPHPSGSSWWA